MWLDGSRCRPQLSGTGAVRVEPQRGRSVAVCQLTTMGTSAPNANPSATP